MPDIKQALVDGVIYDLMDEVARNKIEELKLQVAASGGIAFVESTDTENPLSIRDMDSGTYVFYGRFKPYTGSTSTLTFSSKLLVNVVKQTSASHVMVFYPVNNCVQYLKVTDDYYERKNVYLNDLMDSVGTLSKLETTDKESLVAAINEVALNVADLMYKAIEITSISNNVGTVERGTVVNTVTINWELNKDPISQTLDGGALSTDIRSVTLGTEAAPLGLQVDTTFVLAVTDERGAVANTPTTAVKFLNGVYYGVLAEDATLNSETILTLEKKLQSGKALTFTASPGEGEKIAYAIPERYGTPVFAIGGFEGGFTKAASLKFTNASDYTESYDVWLSDNTGLGSTTVKVS